MTTGTAKAEHIQKPIIFFHGDKGGVGKSLVCSVFTDWLMKRRIALALIDGDTRNPDVSRMFSDSAPVCNANLRVHDGWMDLTDFMLQQSDRAIVVSLPAGVGSDIKREAPRFFEAVKLLQRPVHLFWVINRLPDSINLLVEALSVMGAGLQSKFVVKNLFFGEADKFSRWDNSETRKQFEKSGGKTLVISELHERTLDKLFADNDNVMPFSASVVPISESAKSPHKLSPSENMELIAWLQENHKVFDEHRASLGL